MARKQDLPGPKLKTWSLTLLGVAVCLLVLMGIWVHDPSPSAHAGRLADVRQRELARSDAAVGKGSSPENAEGLRGLARAPVSLPDAAPWIPEGEAVATLELDFQMVAGLSSDVEGVAERLSIADSPSPSEQRWQRGARQEMMTERAAPDDDAGAPDPGAGSTRGAPVAPPGERCGVVSCPAGGVCCNASCGTCALPGETCSQVTCSVPRYPISIPCGRNTCAVGEICCNASCGTCTLPDETCAQAICD